MSGIDGDDASINPGNSAMRSSAVSPVDEDYAGDGTVPQPTPAEAHQRYLDHIKHKLSSSAGELPVLKDDERVSSSMVVDPDELAEDFNDIDDGDSFSVGDGSGQDLADVSTGNTPAPEDDEAAVHAGPTTLPQPAASTTTTAATTAEGSSSVVTAVAVNPETAPVSTVGLVNDGCTCYLNSLLQLLFHLSYLRSAVYRIPANCSGEGTVDKAMQELFFQMQERTTPARTKKLTDAFGWGEQELYIQHDIQEMATLLRDNLEERMKGTPTAGAMTQLFEGRGEQFVETLDKTYVSRSKDVFFDIHIPLGEHTHLLDSIRSLTQRDQLVGDNKYKVEQEGRPAVYKDAEKGYEYVKFPPVTWFHLKRFAMDLTSPTLEMKKVNSRMEFPLVLDLRDLEKGLSPEAREEMARNEKSGSATTAFTTDSPAIYDLQGVIVHRGTVRSGHYYCYIRDWDPASRTFTRWIEFDDEHTRVVSEYVAVEANYGGARGSGGGGGGYNREGPMNNANAYILSYVRRGDAPAILAPSPTDIITQRVKDAMRREMAEEERRTKLERAQRECLVLYVITDEGLAAYCEHNPSELFTRDSRSAKSFAVCVVEVRKSDSVRAVYEAVAAQPGLARRGITAGNCRLWRWGMADRCFRPSSPLVTYDECLRHPANVSDFLTTGEIDVPLAVCVYVQESVCFLPSDRSAGPVALPPGADLYPLVKRIFYDAERGTFSVHFKAPTRVHGLVLALDSAYAYACKVQYILTTDTGDELPLRVYRGPVTDRRVHVPIDGAVLATEILLQCSTGVDVVAVTDAHVAVLPDDLPPAVAAANAVAKGTVSMLAKAGTDRVLLMLKWFDHVSCTVRYVGSVLVDSAATLGSLEPLWHLLMGLPVPPQALHALSAHEARYHRRRKQQQQRPQLQGGEAAAAAGTHHYQHNNSTNEQQRPETYPVYPTSFAFFEEGKGVITRELSPFTDLFACGVRTGAVIVAQSVHFPTVYRHAHVETYYATLLAEIEVRVLEVVARPMDNEAEYRHCLGEHRKLAAKEAEALAARKQKPKLKSSSSSSSLQAAAAAALPVEVDTSLDPFYTLLPALGQRRLETVGDAVLRMPSHYMYETVCDGIALSAGADPDFLRLYRSTSATEPAPEEQPVRDTREVSLEGLVAADGFNVCPVVFFERLSVPRTLAEQSLQLTVTLRDAKGHAQHCELYSASPKETLQSLAWLVRASVRPWELETDPWGSLRATLAAPHYVLVAVERRRRLIRKILEVPMAADGGGGDGQHRSEAKLDPALMDFQLELVPMPPLRSGERRIACCHGDYRMADTHIFGHPFVVTIGVDTTVREGLDKMLAATRVPYEALSTQKETGKNYAVMMYTNVPLHFGDWEEQLGRFWQHTQNSSGFIPNLLLNHPRPKEKPGSRYVAQASPQLKIAKN